MGEAKNNLDINLDTGRLGEANKSIDTEHNAGGLGKTNKTIDTKHDASRADNTPYVDKVNNVEKEAKVCKSNLF